MLQGLLYQKALFKSCEFMVNSWLFLVKFGQLFKGLVQSLNMTQQKPTSGEQFLNKARLREIIFQLFDSSRKGMIFP